MWLVLATRQRAPEPDSHHCNTLRPDNALERLRVCIRLEIHFEIYGVHHHFIACGWYDFGGADVVFDPKGVKDFLRYAHSISAFELHFELAVYISFLFVTGLFISSWRP